MPDFGRSSGGDPSLNEINRADRFIDALATAQPVYSTDAAEAELAFLLSDWRDEVRDSPVTAPVTASDAVAALHGGLATRRRSRGSLALVGSVAAAMLCVGGFGAAVYGSGPGDSLYGMRSSLFGTQQATRDDQVSLASAQLQQVQQLIDQGQWQQAQDKLVEVSSAVQGVDQVESKQDLVQQWNALTYKVVEQDPAATLPPGEPLPVLPSSPLTWLPVPVVEATTTSETTAPSDTTTTSTTSTTATTSGTTETSVPSDSPGPGAPPEVTSTTSPATSTETSTTTPAPATTASSTPVTTTIPPTTTTTTTTTVPSTVGSTATPRPTPSSAAAEAPAASQPRLAPSAPRAEVPATATESAAASVPAASGPPRATTPSIPQEVQSGGGSNAATTTVVPPR